MKDKVKFDLNQLTQPIPQDFVTFDYLAEQKKKMNVKKNPMGFGVGDRFEKNEQVKWQEKLKVYNKFAQKPLNTKSDPQPGPQHYSLINHWPGKK